MSEDIFQRVSNLRRKAAKRFGVPQEKCHIGHLALEGLLEDPDRIAQVDAATDANETYGSVATRSMRVASAMHNSGLKPSDPIIIMSTNNLDVCIPFYAAHYMGYTLCSIDPMNVVGRKWRNICRLVNGTPYHNELMVNRIRSSVICRRHQIYVTIKPKMVFCQKDCVEKSKQALEFNELNSPVITVGEDSELDEFVENHKGTELDFRPNTDFDTSDVSAWFILTSGTTGKPKVVMITYDTLFYGVIEWWVPLKKEEVRMNIIMSSLQWLSALIYYISTPIKKYTRLQSSKPLTPEIVVHAINTYKPDVTAWTPYLLARFVEYPKKVVDLSCFRHILVGGTAMDKPIIDAFKKICPAKLHLCYGMSELLTVVFYFNPDEAPFGSSGKPFAKYLYKLVDDDGKEVTEDNKEGELWLKGGNAFFKGYLNNKEETDKVITADGWIRTGDIFRRDENNYFYFVERKTLLIKYLGFWIPPIQLEEIIKRHPGVSEACVVGLPNPKTMAEPVAAIMRNNGQNVDPQDIFNMIKAELPEIKRLHGGLFFVDSFPTTPSGKVNRTKVKEMAMEADRIMPS